MIIETRTGSKLVVGDAITFDRLERVVEEMRFTLEMHRLMTSRMRIELDEALSEAKETYIE